jgi:hypothetical protein
MAVGDVATGDCDGELHRSVEVGASSGGVALAFTGDIFTVMLLDCSLPTPTNYELDNGLGGHPTTHWVNLPPGSYAMIAGPLPDRVTLQSTFSAPLVGGSCASAGTVSLDPNATTYVDFPTGSRLADGWLRLAGGGNSYDVAPYGLYWDGWNVPGPISLCTDCSLTSCIPLPDNQPIRVTIGDQAVVRFQNVLATPTVTGQTLSQLMLFPVSP